MTDMRAQPFDQQRIWPRRLRLATVLLAAAGCNGLATGGGRGLLGPKQQASERWTIRCRRFEDPQHEQRARRLADMLGNVKGLQAQKLHVATDAVGSTIYYGQYTRVPSPETGAWAFPPELKRDMDLIQRVVISEQMPFAFAFPEVMDKAAAAGSGQWHVSRASGTHTLLVARFYNTPTFNQRTEVAEQYVRQLREEGFPAYYEHQQVRSLVFVGDFEESDLIRTPDGGWALGPRVEQLITRNEEAFRYILDNGHLLKRRTADGQVAPPASYLVPVPGNG